jgi:hypothetical protein
MFVQAGRLQSYSKNTQDAYNFHFSVTNTLTIKLIVNLVDHISQLSLPFAII